MYAACGLRVWYGVSVRGCGVGEMECLQGVSMDWVFMWHRSGAVIVRFG